MSGEPLSEASDYGAVAFGGEGGYDSEDEQFGEVHEEDGSGGEFDDVDPFPAHQPQPDQPQPDVDEEIVDLTGDTPPKKRPPPKEDAPEEPVSTEQRLDEERKLELIIDDLFKSWEFIQKTKKDWTLKGVVEFFENMGVDVTFLKTYQPFIKTLKRFRDAPNQNRYTKLRKVAFKLIQQRSKITNRQNFENGYQNAVGRFAGTEMDLDMLFGRIEEAGRISSKQHKNMVQRTLADRDKYAKAPEKGAEAPPEKGKHVGVSMVVGAKPSLVPGTVADPIEPGFLEPLDAGKGPFDADVRRFKEDYAQFFGTELVHTFGRGSLDLNYGRRRLYEIWVDYFFNVVGASEEVVRVAKILTGKPYFGGVDNKVGGKVGGTPYLIARYVKLAKGRKGAPDTWRTVNRNTSLSTSKIGVSNYQVWNETVDRYSKVLGGFPDPKNPNKRREPLTLKTLKQQYEDDTHIIATEEKVRKGAPPRVYKKARKGVTFVAPKPKPKQKPAARTLQEVVEDPRWREIRQLHIYTELRKDETIKDWLDELTDPLNLDSTGLQERMRYSDQVGAFYNSIVQAANGEGARLSEWGYVKGTKGGLIPRHLAEVMNLMRKTVITLKFSQGPTGDDNRKEFKRYMEKLSRFKEFGQLLNRYKSFYETPLAGMHAEARMQPLPPDSPPDSPKRPKPKRLKELRGTPPATPPHTRLMKNIHGWRDRMKPKTGSVDTPQKITPELQARLTTESKILPGVHLGDREEYHEARIRKDLDEGNITRPDHTERKANFPQIHKTGQHDKALFEAVRNDVPFPDNEAGFMNLFGRLSEGALKSIEPPKTDPELFQAKFHYAKRLHDMGLFPLGYGKYYKEQFGGYNTDSYNTEVPRDLEAVRKGVAQMYKVPEMPVWHSDEQLKGHLEAGLEYRQYLQERYEQKLRMVPKRGKSSERIKLKRAIQGVKDDIKAFKRTLTNIPKPAFQLEDQVEEEKRAQPKKRPRPRGSPQVILQSQATPPFSPPAMPGTLPPTPPSTGRSRLSAGADAMDALKRRLWEKNFPIGTYTPGSEKVRTKPRTPLSPSKSVMSTAAYVARPIEARHIIRLREILQPPGEEHPMFERDHQIYGFPFNDWWHQNVGMFPIQSMPGKKRSFGRHITANTKDRHFIFSVTRKASKAQIRALLGYIRQSLPELSKVTTYLQRKKWDKISGMQTTSDVHELIVKQLKSKPKVTVKLSW
jgi:hypothetical protein